MKWEGLEVATDVREEGELWCRLDDVVIIPNSVTKGHKIMLERMIKLGPDLAKDPEEFQRIKDEIEADVSAHDIVETWFNKSIQLSAKYNISHSEHPKHSPTSGFGLCGDIGDVFIDLECRLTFSWDWFNISSAGKATKLQESGEIGFETANTEIGNEIVRMRFETDVSLGS